MTNAYIVDGVRTAIGNIGGGLSEVRADDLAAHVIATVVSRHPSLDPARIRRAKTIATWRAWRRCSRAFR